MIFLVLKFINLQTMRILVLSWLIPFDLIRSTRLCICIWFYWFVNLYYQHCLLCYHTLWSCPGASLCLGWLDPDARLGWFCSFDWAPSTWRSHLCIWLSRVGHLRLVQPVEILVCLWLEALRSWRSLFVAMTPALWPRRLRKIRMSLHRRSIQSMDQVAGGHEVAEAFPDA